MMTFNDWLDLFFLFLGAVCGYAFIAGASKGL